MCEHVSVYVCECVRLSVCLYECVFMYVSVSM